MADKDEKKEEDERFEYIYNYLTYTRKLKVDRWTKMLSNADFKDLIAKFFGTPSEMILVLQVTPAGLLVPYLEITQCKGKLTYFLKRTPQLITEANYKDLLIPGDMAPNPIEELAVLVEDAYVPILSNPKNHAGWPEVVRADVKKQIYSLRTLIWQVKGKITGQTLLPMPMGIEDILQEDYVDKTDAKTLELKSDIEKIVIKWATQLSEILNEEFTKKDGPPVPDRSELDYWNMRLKNMESLYQQLKDPRVQKMGVFLEQMESPYLEYFQNLIKNVAASLLETRDITLYLKPLEHYFKQIENSEFKDLAMKLKALLHCACLMWSNSKYYTLERMIALLREISNLLISQAVKYINPSTLFEADIDENKQKILEVIPLLDFYQETFRLFKEKIEYYFKGAIEPVPWTFHEKLVFKRIQLFEKRLKEIESLFDVAQDYLKLERIEMAGLKGKSLLNMTYEIYEEFVKAYQLFGEAPYDVLSPDETQFTEDLEEFFIKVEQYDRRLASIFDQVFADCHNLESVFKFIWMMGPIANRPLIMAQLWYNYENLVQGIDKHFSKVKILFDENFKEDSKASRAVVNEYFPPVSAALCMLLKLSERCRFPVECVKLCDHPLITAKMESELKSKYEELESLISSKEQEIFTAWAETVPEICEIHLSKSLLIVRDDDLLEMNFAPELTTLLKEIRYMIIMRRTDLSPEAIDFYNGSEFYFKSTYNLDLIVNWYNKIRTESVPVEFQLIEDDIEVIDELINYGQGYYTWKSDDVPEYIDNLLTTVRKLYARVFLAQDNLKNIMDRLYTWAMMPVLYRKDARDENLLSIADKDDRFEDRFTEIEETAEELKRVLEENYKLFFNLLPESFYEKSEAEFRDDHVEGEIERIDSSEESPRVSRPDEEDSEELPIEEEEMVEEEEEVVDEETQALRREKWEPYLIYVDNLISKGLIQAVSTSICYILDETDPEGNIYPLFEIQLHLEVNIIGFRPRLEIDDPEGFYSFFESLLLDMMKMGTLIQRVDPQIAEEQENYATDLAEEEGIVFMLEETCNRVKLALAEVKEHAQIYETFSWLWIDDKQEYLDYFLRYAKYVSPTDREMLAEHPDYVPENFKPKKPDLSDFKQEIDYFMSLYESCDQNSNEYVACTWLRLDVKPFKQSLLNLICKWANVLKEYLVNLITKQLEDLAEFLKAAMENFTQSIQEDDYDALLVTISYLKEIRDRQFEIEDMFDPIKKTIELLQHYQVVLNPKIFDWLTELPHSWESLKKVAAQVKQVVQPLMTRQIELLKKRLSYHDFKQQHFLEEFHKNDVFSDQCNDPYEKLNKIREEVVTFLNEEKALKDQTVIFEQEMPEFKVTKQVQKEMQLLKTLWDYVNVISTSLNEWKKTTWKKIDVEWMDQECKKLLRELRQLDKDVRSWELYADVEAQVRNMMASLRAVAELQNPAIRDRHWRELMAETRVAFSMTDSTTLEDLLKLQLHKYEEEVKNIVAKSVKEMAMEKVLKELHDTWSTLEFGKELHDRTKLNILKIDEETIETLEDNQVQLQNMLGSKFVGYFLDDILDWQKKLSNADAVINAWFEVQRAWMHLESIFIGSEDIRSQLPEESKRFEKIDRDFKELLREMLSNLNIVKATNRPKLLEKLEELQVQLNFCEKALADYLETKRLIYPRFYFISAADLLDILSNGNNPELVCKHLSKLYDSIAKLQWKMDGDKPTKFAIVMVAKDGETMTLYGSCDCSGKVENWLNNVTDAMKRTVRHLISQAVGNYDEKPREVWIFDHQAQPALCGSQIWWTTEVNMAFMRLEEGFENAFKDYQRKQINQLNALITILCGELNENDRRKIMTICTIDVHARDVVAKMIAMKAENSSSFQWQSQLRHRWDDKAHDCYADICDATFRYNHEYLGNVPRLVITPLTDRCYITLTQSLHLIMGGAPAGPAGTGKTETTKDLGRALGQMVYVFNCSEQMDYKSCGNIYKGLAQVGAWGCFDEFNRISVEVLSVVAVQVKSVLDGVKSGKLTFLFFGEELNLVNTVGMFITMNPGYAGRTELPENLKTLFRPCAMVVPDFDLICEIMLVAEGFQEARLLARKFITLYQLCRELLSKQDHYDWGLRAIKSVLVVAGKLKRDDPQREEDQVLMRALRDFNIPKIITDDVPVFMGLIGDLFPALDVPRKRDLEFELTVKEAAVDLKLQPEDGFILKVVQLEELLHVRHSVFIVGFAGTGKTQVWKTLYRTYFNQKLKPYYNDLNPKAVTNDELFGIINPATREWKDGLFSVIMRDQANMTGNDPKWIIFDGDIDPMWIESLNTVMDDNKVLTLASNERIALTAHMRLLFEISNLRTATPATVSRAGILYINPQDIGWYPFAVSWIETREPSERTNLTILFDKYVPPLVDVMKHRFKKITPLPDICHLQMLCNLLDCFLTPDNVPADCPKEWYELYFVFACIWAFGSATFQDQLIDWRNEFNKWWQNEFKTVKLPAGGNIFHYFIEEETKKLSPWTDIVHEFELDPEIPLQSTLVPTGDTAYLHFFLDILIKKKVPVMLIGAAGSGKSVIVAEKLGSLPDDYNIANVPLNYYTTSEMLQRSMEKYLEKKTGRNYGPPGMKKLIYFIDDMNMPEVDTYGTVQPHTLIRQHIDYTHWYDRAKLTLKEIHNTQYVSCMNPTAGSFTINSRLQRHFAVFAVNFPSEDNLIRIYSQIFDQHLTNPFNKFNVSLLKNIELLLAAALFCHSKISSTFLPTAVKFHYVFNLRDLSNIFQGILFANGEAVPTPNHLIRLYVHEAMRVYSDKLVNVEDKNTFQQLLKESLRKNIPEMDENIIFARPIIYCHFAEGIGEPKYMPIKEWPQLTKLLDEALLNYNDLVSAMHLVLFEDAMYQVCQINRILEAPRGNALLVGVGGSGKQSLSSLASFIAGLEVFQMQLKTGYSMNDLRTDLASLYLKAGLKGIGITFLMTDSHVADERFLVLINDMLAFGEISELFPDEDIDNIVNSMRNEVKQTGMMDTNENCWKFFIDRVRGRLKCVLCFSPVGSTLRNRARQFPAIVNNTSINWVQSWPLEALRSVSARFLEELEELPKEFKKSASLFMSFVHTSVNDISALYLQNERRYNYTTPKSFLEQIALYSKLLAERTYDIKATIDRLRSGLEKLESCAGQVSELRVILAVQEVELKKKNEIADKILVEVRAENAKAEAEKMIVSEEEAKIAEIKEVVSERQKRCDEDLMKAEPAVRQAEAALDTLNKNNLTELKSFGTPPEQVAMVAQAVLVLFAPRGQIPKDRSWKACKAMMGHVDTFLSQLRNYDKENIHAEVVKAIQPYINNKEFDPEIIYSKSQAAAGLCSWVRNIMVFHYINETVKPLRNALAQANAELKAALDHLNSLRGRLAELQKVLDVLGERMNAALEEKQKCQDEADATALTIDLANRLVNGLASEKIRWTETVETLTNSEVTVPGNILLITAFLSYMGCFTRKYRHDLMNENWLPYLETLEPKIPRTPSLDVLTLLSDDAQIAQWNNEGLPTDKMSSENATILMNSSRWPLMIDPQLQGLKWIKSRYGEELQVLRLTQPNYLSYIEISIANGKTVLIENIMESIDPVLDPVIKRDLIKKGRAIKIWDKEIDYDHRFRLILQTKLANPHYKPEIQAQTTLINFTVTKDGLEEQLLGDVVKAERPDLESKKAELTIQQNSFKISLKVLEDDLLHRLSTAGPNILSDVDLVINLETTKKTAAEIKIKVAEAKVTAVKIDEAREIYRTVACRASLLYFVLNDLSKINMLYQFSLKAFSVVFQNAIKFAEAADTLVKRVALLIDSITYLVFIYTSRGLFENDKLTFLCQMTIQIFMQTNEITQSELDFLLRFPYIPELNSPVDFLSNVGWGGIKYLSQMDDFRNLEKDIEGAAKRWKKFVESETPERENFPQDWKNKTALQRLCIMRCLRLDRMTYALRCFVEEKLGSKFVESRSPPFHKSFEETSSITPVFFILSPGVDPLKDVEKLGKQLNFTFEGRNFHNVSLGQGQEPIAEEAMIISANEGHWVILQNVHLVKKWLPILEKRMEQLSESPHEDYRLFISAEPSPDPRESIIPQGILESAIKITNEPPSGIQANIHKALDNFSQETLESCSKETEFKAILFALCYYHAVLAERRKFGAQGWNRSYPFNFGDLTISVSVLFNYLENSIKVPWEDLRYLFGEIMYGGHITDDWDRRLCRTYLMVYLKSELVDGELYLAPEFLVPPNSDYVTYHQYVDDFLPSESPVLYGLHPNAEIGFLTSTAENLFKTLLEMLTQTASNAAGGDMLKEDKMKGILEDLLDKLPEEFNIAELQGKVEDRTPYVTVALQECERMNLLCEELRRSLRELELGLKGELTINAEMEDLQNYIMMDAIPPSWTKRAYPSELGLNSWFADVLNRINELSNWTADFSLPASVWLGGFFNPQSFLTAIMQQTARKNEWPLDKMCLYCEVMRKYKEEITAAPREGAYINGLYMDGARWDTQTGCIMESRFKELYPLMPVMYIRAITQDKQDLRNMYECPVYKTRSRGPTYVWTFNLKTKEKAEKWILAGVAILLQI
ncbi:PREDICTED: dynein beta chain, ciliary-like [Dufourea novaeangliae]|uniref:dynein beta chain, ciliary-like n=1 Tax=Dufourea novaeangliae TaxID=178035 RepID=UPI00076705C5|nr:PREDICTED: dynein beta chain, ciliary-like [Dufourea novaeangliae]